MTSTHVTLNDRARDLRPSDAVTWVRSLNLPEWGKGVILLAALYVAGSPIVAWTMVGLTVAFGFGLAHIARRRGATAARITPRLALTYAVLAGYTGLFFLLLDYSFFGIITPEVQATLASLCWIEWMKRRPEVSLGPRRWWAHDEMVNMLLAVGAVKLSNGEAVKVLYPQPGQSDEFGEWRHFQVALPMGWTAEQAIKRRDAIAAYLNKPSALIHLEHRKDQPANAFTMVLLHKRKRQAVIPAQLPDRTDWTQPVALGADRLGRPVTFQTTNVHSAIVAATGAGKTALIRFILLHAGLDPRVPIYGINGKSDVEDLDPIASLCVRYVSGATRAACDGAYEILREVEQIVVRRGGEKRADRQPVVLLIDEWYRLLGAAKRYDKQRGQEMDELLSELAATARGLGVHIILLLQKGTDGYLSAETSVNTMQKLFGMQESPDEIRYVIGFQPDATLVPDEPGEFLVKRGKTMALTQVPFLDDEAFLAGVEKGRRLRQAEPLQHPLGDARPALEAVPRPEPDPLLVEVWDALGADALQPAELHARLPEGTQARVPSNTLGKRLRAFAEAGEPVRVRWDKGRQRNLWERHGNPWWERSTEGSNPSQAGLQAPPGGSATVQPLELLAAP